MCNLLTAVFVALKLCGEIEWSWVWVTSPFWIGVILNILMEECGGDVDQ